MDPMKTYRGYRVDGGCAVEVHFSQPHERPTVYVVEGTPRDPYYFLPSRLDLRYYFPGYDWGPRGLPSSMKQLSLAILVDALGEDLALECYEDFQDLVVTAMGDTWETTDEVLQIWYRDWKAPCFEDSPEDLARV
jgi:hypothetical protein